MADDTEIEGEPLKLYRLLYEKLGTRESFDTPQELLERIKYYVGIFGDKEKFRMYEGRYREFNMAQLTALISKKAVVQSKMPPTDS
jgi:hypothetical protein